MTTSPDITPDPGAQRLLAAFEAASAALTAAAAAIDAINVYPVPDGDTGSNMAATLREAVAAGAGATTAPEVARRLARGALYGARGNSGVILSQAMRGFADGLDDARAFDGAAIAAALSASAASAYRAVAHPVEGTMLTVLRAAAEAAVLAIARDPGARAEAVLAAAAAAAERAEDATMDQLEALREAGVPDSGGEGICVILGGMLASLRGEPMPVPALAAPGRPLATLGDAHGGDFGFCVEAVIERRDTALDTDAIRTAAGAGTNRSVVVVGDAAAVHVHLHADDAEAALATLGTFGAIVRRKVDDMSAQHVRYRAGGSGATLKHVLHGGAGHAAGLSAGDVVVALDGLRVDGGSLAARVRALPAGTEVTLHGFRRDELHTWKARLQAAPATTAWLEPNPDAPPEAVARRERWLAGELRP